MNFIDEPSWLDDILKAIPELPAKQTLLSGRVKFGTSKPWPYYIEHVLTDIGLPSTALLDYITTRFPSLMPVSLDTLDVPNLNNLFPAEFTQKFFVAPFNASQPFLSVAVVEPDLLKPFYDAYLPWAKTANFSLLQYFAVLPSSFENFTNP